MAKKSLKTSLVFVLLISLSLIFSVQIYSRYFFELPKLYSLEKISDVKDSQHVDQAIASMAYDLSQTALDFGIWTSTYEYIQYPNAWFTQQYFTHYIFYSKNINGFVITNSSSDIVYQRAYNLTDASLIEEKVFNENDLRDRVYKRLHQSESTEGEYAMVKGFMQSELGLIQFAASKILPSSGVGISRGMVLSWRYVDELFRAELSRRHNTKVKLLDLSLIPSSPATVKKIELLKTKPENYVSSREGRKINWLIYDIDGKPALFAELEVPSRSFNSSLLSFSLLLGMVTALLSLIFIGGFITNKFIKPLIKIQDVMSQIVSSGDYTQRLSLDSSNELGSTSQSLNYLLSHIARQEDLLLQKNKKLEQISEEDVLTRIYNRRGFDSTLGRQWQQAIIHSTPLAVFMLDVDNFKSYNDNYGHPAGDRALKAVAQCLQDQLHMATDTIGRYGGEEFAVILTMTCASDAEVVANRLCRSVQSLSILHEHQSHSQVLTISIGGLILTPKKDQNIQDAISIADEQLYKAKVAGRNQVVFTSQYFNNAKDVVGEKL